MELYLKTQLLFLSSKTFHENFEHFSEFQLILNKNKNTQFLENLNNFLNCKHFLNIQTFFKNSEHFFEKHEQFFNMIYFLKKGTFFETLNKI